MISRVVEQVRDTLPASRSMIGRVVEQVRDTMTKPASTEGTPTSSTGGTDEGFGGSGGGTPTPAL